MTEHIEISSFENMDFITDKFPTALSDAQAYAAFPGFVDQAELPEKAELDGLHKSAFANPSVREYPLHTPVCAFLSAIHYRGRGGADPEIVGRIKAAAVAHDLEGVLTPYEPFFEQQVKQASAPEPVDEERYALHLTKEGSELKAYPIRHQDDVAASAQRALNDFQSGDLPLPLFARAARELVKAASVFSVRIDRRVTAVGSDRLFNEHTARACIPAGAETQAAYENLVKAAGLCESFDDRDKVAVAWAELDEAVGVKRASTPYEFLWSGPSAEAVKSAAADMVLFDAVAEPVLVPWPAIKSVTEDRARAALRKEAAELLLGLSKEASAADASARCSSIDAATQAQILRALAEIA